SAACSARSAWSSSAAGAPNAAIAASPTNFSTVPPAASISAAARSKKRSWSRRIRSGSSLEPRAVEPTRSANRTVATFRSSASSIARIVTAALALRAVPDVLIYGDTLRSPEMRHEIPLTIPDGFLYAEREDRRYVAVSALEVPRLRGLDGLKIYSWDELG